MNNKPRILDDIAGLAGGAFSAAMGVREEIHSIIRTQIDEVMHNLQLVRKEDVDVLHDMTVKARMKQEENEKTIQKLQKQVTDLQEKLKHTNV